MDDPLDDLDQVLDDAAINSTPQKNPKKGRRAGQDNPEDATTALETAGIKQGRRAPHKSIPDIMADAEDIIDENKHDSAPSKSAPPKKARRSGGWSDDKSAHPEVEDSRFKMRTPSPGSDNSDNDIPVIPDLEDNVMDDMTVTIAQAPTVAVNRVATYRELDNDLLEHAQFLSLDNEVDLKLLGKCLSSEADVKEEDKPWDWDNLFTEVTSELLTEWAGEGPKEEDMEPPLAIRT